MNNDGSRTSLANANKTAGFSVVKYFGTGADATIGHGLNSTVEFIIVKGLETSNDWSVLHKDGGDGDFLQLNGTSAESGAGSIFGSTFTRPTSSVFSVGNTGETGTADKEYIAYCWHSVTGKRKFGTYTGNGSASGTVVEPGFSPDFVMVKRIDGSSAWGVFDSQRSGTYYQKGLRFNSTGSEYGETDANSACEFLAVGHSDASNGGFRFRDSGSPYNVSSGTYIYWAEKIH